jgi:hypothetical protein
VVDGQVSLHLVEQYPKQLDLWLGILGRHLEPNVDAHDLTREGVGSRYLNVLVVVEDDVSYVPEGSRSA